MKLSISNIAWSVEYDTHMYEYMSQIGFEGLEIAPTRIYPVNPYNNNSDLVRTFSGELKKNYNLKISSMQSIWYAKKEKLFGSIDERSSLMSYTKDAINFASALGCKNLVFGCPKNRIIDNDNQYNIAVDFFRELGEYSVQKMTTLSLEPNPMIYGTNFINETSQAFDLVRVVDSNGFRVNLDIGTIIENKENVSSIMENINLINHIHVSEPWLIHIEKRLLHNTIADILKNLNYDKYISIEMKNANNIESVKNCMNYVKDIFE